MSADLKRQLKAQAEQLRRSLSITLSSKEKKAGDTPSPPEATADAGSNAGHLKPVRLVTAPVMPPPEPHAPMVVTMLRKPKDLAQVESTGCKETLTTPHTAPSLEAASVPLSPVRATDAISVFPSGLGDHPSDAEVPLSEEMHQCKKILREIQRHPDAGPFLLPVDVHEYPMYSRIVARPMDLGSIHTKLCRGEYFSPDDLQQDVRLVWHNCRRFNPEGHPLLRSVDLLESIFNRRYNKLFEDSQSRKQQDSEDAQTKPLQQRIDILKQELQQLRTDPSLTVDKAKVQEVKSDEPLGFGDIRKLTQMINELQNDAEAINKVVNMIRQSCPKAVAIVNDDLDLDLELLDPRTAREVQATCEKAIATRKRKRSVASSSHSHTRTPKVAKGSPPPPSDCRSDVSKKSAASSFCRETLAAPLQSSSSTDPSPITAAPPPPRAPVFSKPPELRKAALPVRPNASSLRLPSKYSPSFMPRHSPTGYSGMSPFDYSIVSSPGFSYGYSGVSSPLYPQSPYYASGYPSYYSPSQQMGLTSPAYTFFNSMSTGPMQGFASPAVTQPQAALPSTSTSTNPVQQASNG
jgi:hypothetical protein